MPLMVRPGTLPFDVLAATIAARPEPGEVPLLALRVRPDAIGPTARADRLRRAGRAVLRGARRVLRDEDALACGPGEGGYIAALLARRRSSGIVATADDCRAALARLAASVEAETALALDTGWTLFRTGEPLQFAFERALLAGRHERERHELVSTVKHELRTPLTSIRGYLETVIDEGLDPATRRRFLETARGEALRMERLIDGLFDLPAAPRPAAAAAGDLAAALAVAFDAIAPLAAMRGTALFQVDPAAYTLAIDTDRLTQVLINLLENAVKHGREGGRVFVSILPAEGERIVIWIDDDGPGVPRRERSKIFEFARRGARARAGGSGLGLSLVRLLVESCGGGVSVDDSVLGGARFGLVLPLGDLPGVPTARP